MNENKKVSWLYVALTPVIASVAVIFRMILKQYYIDASNGLYERNTVTPQVFGIFVAVAVVFILTSAFVMRMDAMPKQLKYGSVVTAVSSVIVACLLVVCAITFFTAKKDIIMPGSAEETVYKLRFICSVLAIPSAAYFFAVAFTGKNKNEVLSWLSFLPIALELAYLMAIYFDKSFMINSPERVYKQIAVIVLMVFQLFETRYHIGKSKPIIYFILSNATVLLLAIAFVPDVILFVKGSEKFSVTMAYALYGTGMALYALTRNVDFALGCNFEAKKTSNKPPKNDLFTPDEDDEEETEEENND